jgi:hypothetical protein
MKLYCLIGAYGINHFNSAIQKNKGHIRKVGDFFYPSPGLTVRRQWSLSRLIIAVASAGYAGFSPRAPGTVGTAVGILVYLLFPLPPWSISQHRGLLILACWFRSGPIRWARKTAQIVIDEVGAI